MAKAKKIATKKDMKETAMPMAGLATPDNDKELEYKAENDYRTLADAGIIHQDKERLNRAMAFGEKRHSGVKSIADLKKARQRLMDKEEA
jgi:hypothetical protein